MTPEAGRRFIRDNLALRSFPALPAIRLHAPHPGSGLRRLCCGSTPYWAYPWAGGLALARYFGENGQTVAGKRVLDFGCGGGLVAIAAARAGAAAVFAADPDPLARTAAGLNAEANGVALTLLPALPKPPPPGIDLVAAGDVFYSRAVAAASAGYLGACKAAGLAVLIGDPGRRHLPRARLTELACYPVADFGNVPATGFVFAL